MRYEAKEIIVLSQTQTLNFQAHLFHIPVQNENKLSCVTTRFLWLHYTLYLIFRVSCLQSSANIHINTPHPSISPSLPTPLFLPSLPTPLSLFPSPYPTLYLPLYPTISLSSYTILLCNNLYVYRGI